jgi:hypothetical protein
MIERRKTWRDIALQRWNAVSKKGKPPSILSHRTWNEITEDVETNLHTLASILIDSGITFKLVVSGDYGWVYSNDIELIDRLKQLKILTSKTYTEAIVDRPKNTIKLKNPKYKFRSYFKINKITNNQKDNLVNFLTNQQQYIRISPALQSWCNGTFHRIQDYFFVDHSDMSWLTMLALVNPSLIRKTQQIIPATK